MLVESARTEKEGTGSGQLPLPELAQVCSLQLRDQAQALMHVNSRRHTTIFQTSAQELFDASRFQVPTNTATYGIKVLLQCLQVRGLMLPSLSLSNKLIKRAALIAKMQAEVNR